MSQPVSDQAPARRSSQGMRRVVVGVSLVCLAVVAVAYSGGGREGASVLEEKKAITTALSSEKMEDWNSEIAVR